MKFYKICKAELENELLSLYNDGLSITSIAEVMNLSYFKVQQILGRLTNLIRHEHIFDDSIWGSNSINEYYLLGLLFTYGTVSYNNGEKFIEISLQENDRILLEDIKKIFKSKKPLCVNNDQLRFTLYSDTSYDYLNSFGITEKKPSILKHIPKEFFIHFLRGVFDGSGSIIGTKYINITLCVTISEKFAQQIVNMYNDIGFDVFCYCHNGKYFIKKCGKDGFKVLATLYSNKGMFLPHKYEKFLSFTRLTLDELMMELAHSVSKRSTCIRRKVGCIISNYERTNITSMGYNGSVKDGPNHCESSFTGKCGCVHAEENALVKNKDGKILYCTTVPCKKCAKLIINAGIKEVFYDAGYRSFYSLGLFNRSQVSCKRLRKSNFVWKNEIAKILEWKNN